MSEWEVYIDEFALYLRMDKALSDNSIEAYLRDIGTFASYLSLQVRSVDNGKETHVPLPNQVVLDDLQQFLACMHDAKESFSVRTQARLISGIRAFFRFMVYEGELSSDPTELLEGPRLDFKLPAVLSVAEIDRMEQAIDLSKPEGHRNVAIIETLYSCGLRVSELVGLKLSNIYSKEQFVRVQGKGSKERLVPIGSIALMSISFYVDNYRTLLDIKKGHEDFVFLNRRGRQLTREMIFTIVKRTAEGAGITKKVSPHTFRHSFATHLIEGGADIRAVQQMLGHESITTTEIYTHLDQRHLRDAISRFHPRNNWA